MLEYDGIDVLKVLILISVKKHLGNVVCVSSIIS